MLFERHQSCRCTAEGIRNIIVFNLMWQHSFYNDERGGLAKAVLESGQEQLLLGLLLLCTHHSRPSPFHLIAHPGL